MPVAWVIGASSGIGREVSRLLAADGYTVVASARSAEALEGLARENPAIHAYPVDVTDQSAVAELVASVKREHGDIDLILCAAAVWHPMLPKEYDLDKFRQSFDVNVVGVAGPIFAVLPQMMERRSGHIAIISSVAGYRGLTKAAAYGSTKAALIHFAEVLKIDLARYDIDVSVINPGFVKTPMTAQNDFPMPYIMEPEDAAKKIVAGLKKKKFEIAFPWQLVSILKLLASLPYGLYFWVSKQTTR